MEWFRFLILIYSLLLLCTYYRPIKPDSQTLVCLSLVLVSSPSQDYAPPHPPTPTKKSHLPDVCDFCWWAMACAIFFLKSNKGPRCYKARAVYKSWQPEKVRQLLCQVLPVTFISSWVKICRGNDVYQVPQPSTFHKTPATLKLKENPVSWLI